MKYDQLSARPRVVRIWGNAGDPIRFAPRANENWN